MLGVKRRAVVGERRRGVGVREQQASADAVAGLAQVDQEADQVAALVRRHRGGQALGHQRSASSHAPRCRPSAIRTVRPWRGRGDVSSVAVSACVVALDDLAVGGGDGDGLVSLLDLAAGPEDRLDDLLGLDAAPTVDRSGPTVPPWPPTRGTIRQANFGDAKTSAPRVGVAVSAGVGATRFGDASTGSPAHAALRGRGGTGVRGVGLGPAGLPSSCGTSQSRPSRLSLEPLLGVVLGVAEDADRPA